MLMPWRIEQEHGRFQVHKENADGSLGEAVGKPHDTRGEALAHLKALYSNTSDSSAMSGAVHFEADALNPRLLHFKDFILARPETNKNRDSVDVRGIEELAKTIAGMPIDYNHDGRKNFGFFTAGRIGPDNELRVDGAIWLDRCQDNNVDPNDVIRGSFGMSIEADATSAECSICHGVFANSTDYCEHLRVQGNDNGVRSRLRHGSIRIMRGLRALGGAFTMNPAGSNTGLDSTSGIAFAASHQEALADDHVLTSPEIIDVWLHHILIAAIQRRKDISEADKEHAKEEYGDVEYADEENKKYPLDKEHVHAAWSYINMPKNAAKYSPDELTTIKNKIKRAAKKFGMEISDDKKQNKEKASMDEENKKPVDGEQPDEHEKEMEAMKANYEAMKTQMAELTAQLAVATAERADTELKLQAAETQLTEVRQKLEAAEIAVKEYRVNTLRAALVGSVLDEAEFDSQKDMLLSLPRSAIDLMTRNKPEAGGQRMQAATDAPAAPRLF